MMRGQKVSRAVMTGPGLLRDFPDDEGTEGMLVSSRHASSIVEGLSR